MEKVYGYLQQASIFTNERRKLSKQHSNSKVENKLTNTNRQADKQKYLKHNL